MSKELIKQEWYENLIEECRVIITEAVFTSRWALVEGYWKLGERIREEGDKITKLLQQVAVDTKVSERTLWYALQTYDKYPDINKIPEGKNITWKKLITKYLTAPKKNYPKLEGGSNISIKHGDFRKLIKEIKDETIDLVLTDPPYPAEYLPLWKDLSEESSRILKPGKFLISYSGQNNLPKILQYLSENLDYYWMMGLYHKGQTGQRFEVNMWNRFKPILVFQKPPKTKQRTWTEDMIISERQDKEKHEWGQSVEPFEKLLNVFSQEGDTICDPFFGGGSVIEACLNTKRHFVGYEIEKEYFELVSKRIK